MQGIAVAIFCFALALLLLLFPNTDFAYWIGREIDTLLDPHRNAPREWELKAGVFFVLVGMAIAIFKWRNS